MKSLEILYAKNAQTIDILSPAVGRAGNLPDSGRIVTGGSDVGTLEILGTQCLLQLPAHLEGKVATTDEYRIKAVCYGELLFSLFPIEARHFEEENGDKKALSSSQNYHEICAITQGIFYRRPSPDAAAYVEVGSVVKIGQVLGLVEVMKCFNQVIYTGTTLPPVARVVEICAEDGAEVQYRQALFRFEPML